MNRLKLHAFALVVTIFVYAAIASLVFQVRHPWATDTERQVWIGSTLRFEKVPYEVMRPREVK